MLLGRNTVSRREIEIKKGIEREIEIKKEIEREIGKGIEGIASIGRRVGRGEEKEEGSSLSSYTSMHHNLHSVK